MIFAWWCFPLLGLEHRFFWCWWGFSSFRTRPNFPWCTSFENPRNFFFLFVNNWNLYKYTAHCAQYTVQYVLHSLYPACVAPVQTTGKMCTALSIRIVYSTEYQDLLQHWVSGLCTALSIRIVYSTEYQDCGLRFQNLLNPYHHFAVSM